MIYFFTVKVFYPALQKWDPRQRISYEKLTYFHGTSPYAFTCEYPPPANTLERLGIYVWYCLHFISIHPL